MQIVLLLIVLCVFSQENYITTNVLISLMYVYLSVDCVYVKCNFQDANTMRTWCRYTPREIKFTYLHVYYLIEFNLKQKNYINFT